MPLVKRYDDDPDPVSFPITGHLTTADEAATLFEWYLKQLTAKYGGEAHRLHPKLTRNAHGIRWTAGPFNWAQICADWEDMETESFLVFHENGDTIFFQDRDDVASLGLRTTHPSKAYEKGAQEAAERIRKRMPSAFHEIGMALGQTLEDNPYKKD
jgi:hypothetical protein